MDIDENQTFDLGRWHCELEAQPAGAFFRAVAMCWPAQGEPVQLPQDAQPYATRPEALRHAQQQALRYARQH
ncbi:hypothetical protein SAMN05216567_1366 [Variovorax sp. OK605]|jgi:hypothetical protein|uniref:hypothetical protein n=1 Tax=Variovorax sp. OK605 TaxID=1855317 RepID=UPI0008E740D2|nr:hypothetical protein [Variovorax sp. OK605]SFQ74413.1 hypothetical protein SAMN05216567_1366 [Variovorax sp. OK605]